MSSYLQWVIENTKTVWWHDSADPEELRIGLERGAIGVTTNPYLANLAIRQHWRLWEDEVRAAMAAHANAEEWAEALMRIVVTRTAEVLLPRFEGSGGTTGYVCGQVNPMRAGDREAMLAMAKRYSAWTPNIAVKLPVTSAGLDVLEECVAEGITVAGTVSFTVPQALAIAERHRAGCERARARGITPGRCFPVIMIGRLDDYLREVSQDTQAAVSEADIRLAGIAVTKRASALYQERGYEAEIIVAAMRGPHHMTELAGAALIMSIAPGQQGPLAGDSLAKETRIERPVPAEVLARLSAMPEFVRAYEPDGMKPAEFVSYGATQRTLSQFCEVGWRLLETFELPGA